MDDQKFSEIDDLFDLTDTEASSSSTSSDNAVYESSQPFILELHELKKDDPTPTDEVPDAKSKRHKKKKKRAESKKSHDSVSSDSMSEASSIVSVPAEEHAREEFFDARESYHDLPESQSAGPTAGAALAQALSQHGQDPKLHRPPSSSTVETTETHTQPSTITKPSRQSR